MEYYRHEQCRWIVQRLAVIDFQYAESSFALNMQSYEKKMIYTFS